MLKNDASTGEIGVDSADNCILWYFVDPRRILLMRWHFDKYKQSLKYSKIQKSPIFLGGYIWKYAPDSPPAQPIQPAQPAQRLGINTFRDSAVPVRRSQWKICWKHTHKIIWKILNSEDSRENVQQIENRDRRQKSTSKTNYGRHQLSTDVDAPRGENWKYEFTMRKGIFLKKSLKALI